MKLIQVGIGNANPAQRPKVFELEPVAEAAKVHRLNPAVKE